MRQSIIITALLLGTTTAEASTVLAYITQDGSAIWIAGDSRISTVDGRFIADTACKVMNFRDVVFAATGRISATYSPFELARRYLRREGNRNIGFRSNRLADEFNRVIAETEEPNSIAGTHVIGFFEQSIPVLSFRIVPDDPIQRSGRDPGLLVRMGKTDRIDDRSIESEVDLHARLSAMIRIQQASTPNQVGGPIDIIRLTTSGAEWVGVKPDCR